MISQPWTPDDMAYRPGGLSAETPRVSEKRTQKSDKAKKCIDHPDAPHGFNRDRSLAEDRYVCDCEDWEPPKREWQGLTDEEILEAAGIDGADTWVFETAYAIEAKLKDKNT